MLEVIRKLFRREPPAPPPPVHFGLQLEVERVPFETIVFETPLNQDQCDRVLEYGRDRYGDAVKMFNVSETEIEKHRGRIWGWVEWRQANRLSTEAPQ